MAGDSVSRRRSHRPPLALGGYLAGGSAGDSATGRFLCCPVGGFREQLGVRPRAQPGERSSRSPGHRRDQRPSRYPLQRAGPVAQRRPHRDRTPGRHHRRLPHRRHRDRRYPPGSFGSRRDPAGSALCDFGSQSAGPPRPAASAGARAGPSMPCVRVAQCATWSARTALEWGAQTWAWAWV